MSTTQPSSEPPPAALHEAAVVAGNRASQGAANAEASAAERLISAAGEIFAEKGPNATVREICRAAGCSVAAINYHFGDKNQLYLNCVQAACEGKQRANPFPIADLPTTAEERLGTFLETMALRMAAENNVSWHNGLMLREVIEPSEGVADFLADAFKKDFERLLQVIGELLEPNHNSEQMRHQYANQVLARCMFLRTGKNLRRILQLDNPNHEDPRLYAQEICRSLLDQFKALDSQTNDS
ncbi:MAG: TetR/AcrR family transcriptional regulator [Pirellulaceae bacterium]